MYSLLPSGSFLPNFAALGDTAFKFDFSFMLNNTVEFAVIVFAFLFVDLVRHRGHAHRRCRKGQHAG